VLFATPHVHASWDTFPWSWEREELFEGALAEMRVLVAEWGLDLRRGFEVFPTELREDAVVAQELEGTGAVLVEFPGEWLTTFRDPLATVALAGEAVEAAGLVPVLAHPERCSAARSSPRVLAEFARRGWLLCVNAPSLLGRHGRAAERVAWELLDEDVVSLAASDGHRASRPPTLDRAYAAVASRYGSSRARRLFTGAALGLY
jgi:protein-tyrosine phosphatase